MADYFATLTDTGFIEDVAIIVGAAMGAALAETAGEQYLPYDLPSEAYGIILIVAMELPQVPLKKSQRRRAQLGGGVHTIDNLAARYGVQSKVQGVLA